MPDTRMQSTAERGCGPLSPLFDEALVWASSLHRTQLRKGTNVPYLAHLMGVSSLVLEDGGTEIQASAGLLHDTVEDWGIQIEPDLRRKFGCEVLKIVIECSDAMPVGGAEKPPWAIRKQRYVDHLEVASPSALIVSAADKLHNARTILSDLDATRHWPDFNACYHQTLWYYEIISKKISRLLPDSRSGRALAVVVNELYEATPAVHRLAKVAQQVPDCPGEPRCNKVADTSVLDAMSA